MTAIVNTLKEAGQDYEFYPTTTEIIVALYWQLKSHKKNAFYDKNKIKEASSASMLFEYESQSINLMDIGAGDCKVYRTLKKISDENFIHEESITTNDKEIYLSDYERRANCLSIDKYYVMEKSQILLDRMIPEAIVVGTALEDQVLLDKSVDVIYMNPPYSRYAEFSTKVIREANASFIYLLIPKRWGSNRNIAQAIKERQATVKVVGDFDFLNAEDRKARAKVSLIEIDLRGKAKRARKKTKGHYRGMEKTYEPPSVDPFTMWFNDHFFTEADKAEASKLDEALRSSERNETIKQELVAGNLIPALVQLYDKELAHLINTYRSVAQLDPVIMRELDIKIESVKEALKLRIQGLKTLYWAEIFKNLDSIKSRLTSVTRERLQRNLTSNTNIDFTERNIRSVVIQIIKLANQYYDSQVLEIFDRFTGDGESIHLYKSNRHWAKGDSWRFAQRLKESGQKYALDYRIVMHNYLDDWEQRSGNMTHTQITAIGDIIVVAKNFGYHIDPISSPMPLKEKNTIYFKSNPKRILKKGTKTNCGKIDKVYIHTSKPNSNGERIMESNGRIYVYDKDHKDEDQVQYEIDGQYLNYSIPKVPDDVFMEVRGHFNGNTHYKLNQRFLRQLNLVVGQLRHWVKDPKHASEEFDIPLEEAQEYWNSNFMLLPENLPALLPHFHSKDEPEEEEVLEEVSADAEICSNAALEPSEANINGTLF
jgi:hypothetical protein